MKSGRLPKVCKIAGIDNGTNKSRKGMGHNYSPEARRSFKARHRRNIAKGKSSAAWWANKVFWAGKGGSTKRPPKSQKRKFGK